MLASCFVIIQYVPNYSVFPLFFSKFILANIDCLNSLDSFDSLDIFDSLDSLDYLDSLNSLVVSVEFRARGLRLDLLLALFLMQVGRLNTESQ